MGDAELIDCPECGSDTFRLASRAYVRHDEAGIDEIRCSECSFSFELPFPSFVPGTAP